MGAELKPLMIAFDDVVNGIAKSFSNTLDTHIYSPREILSALDGIPKVEAVEVETLKAWLYEIAMNNTDNYLCKACEEIIHRLDGLRTFKKER